MAVAIFELLTEKVFDGSSYDFTVTTLLYESAKIPWWASFKNKFWLKKY